MTSRGEVKDEQPAERDESRAARIERLCGIDGVVTGDRIQAPRSRVLSRQAREERD